MKKIISILLATLMLVSLALPVVAASPITGSSVSGPTTGDVEIEIKKNDDPETPGDEGTTYAVALSWETMVFTYKGIWDAEELAYTGRWENSSANINITNSSNAPVDVDAYFDSLGTVSKTTNGVTATLNHYDFQLASAAIAGVATTGAISVSVTGAPKVSTGFSVGTVTVAISTVD